MGTGIGWTIKRKYFPRSGAKVGDIIAVTGHLGLFSAYMYSVVNKKNGSKIPDTLREAIRKEYISRIDLPYALIENTPILDSCNAATDISDGLLGDIARIAMQSGVGVRIFVDKIPITDNLLKMSELLSKHPYYFPCCVGGDLQIALVLDRKKWDITFKKLKKNNLTLYPIGEIIAEQRMYLSNSFDKAIEEPVDWENFRNLNYNNIFLKVADKILPSS